MHLLKRHTSVRLPAGAGVCGGRFGDKRAADWRAALRIAAAELIGTPLARTEIRLRPDALRRPATAGGDLRSAAVHLARAFDVTTKNSKWREFA